MGPALPAVRGTLAGHAAPHYRTLARAPPHRLVGNGAREARKRPRSALALRCGSARQLELPGLGDEVLPEAAVRLTRRALESRLLVEVARRGEVLLRPQRDALVTRGARKAHALGDEAAAQPQAARPGLHQQQPQLRGSRLARDEEDAPCAAAVDFRDPAALTRGIELSDELGADRGHQCLEFLVPAVLLEVQRAVALDDPADVSGAMSPQGDFRPTVRWREDRTEGAHRLEHRAPARMIERREHRADLLLRAALERSKHPPAEGGEPQLPATRILRRRRAGEEPLSVEAAEDPAQVAAVESELGAELGGGDSRTVRDLVHHPHLGARGGALEQTPRQRSEERRVGKECSARGSTQDYAQNKEKSKTSARSVGVPIRV